MVKRSKPPEPPPLALKESHESARAKLQDRIAKAQELKARPVSPENVLAFNKDYEKWDAYNETLLTSLFTNDTPASDYRWSVPIGVTMSGGDSPYDDHRRNRESLEKKSDHLESLIERIELIPLAAGVSTTPQPTALRAVTDRVFLVHGHDTGVREMVARYLERLGLSPVVLHEQPSGGKTIIEKLEHHADVDFAVVLLTPDDEGRSRGDADLRLRARQNVVLELGFFVGRLGRSRVCALHKGSLELPSDILGVVYVPFDEGGGWRLLLAKELKQAGFAIDMNQVV